MPTDRTRLAQRLRRNREAIGLTQEEVAARVGVPRPSVVEIEAGRRNVSGLELERFASIFGKAVAELLDASEAETVARFRRDELAELPDVAGALQQCLDLVRRLADLERLAGLDRPPQGAVRYDLPVARTPANAIAQGAGIAEAERRRLALGDAAIFDLVGIFEASGVRTALIEMPTAISGLSLVDPGLGALIVANRSEHALRRAFSYAHEYAHVLFDQPANAIVSKTQDATSMREVRANAFASAFLMPEQGLRRHMTGMGKGIPSVEEGEMPTAGRRKPRSNVQLHDVTILAHAFGVSRSAMTNRLRTLRILTSSQFTHLRNEDSAFGNVLEKALALPEHDHAAERDRFQRRFVRIALEAYARGRIDSRRLEKHLVADAGLRRGEARKLLSSLDASA